MRLDRAVFVPASSLLFFAVFVLAAERVGVRVLAAVFAACRRRFGAARRAGALPALRRGVTAVLRAAAFFAVLLRAVFFLLERFAVVAMICSCC